MPTAATLRRYARAAARDGGHDLRRFIEFVNTSTGVVVWSTNCRRCSVICEVYPDAHPISGDPEWRFIRHGDTDCAV